jgi:hypothetical protein
MPTRILIQSCRNELKSRRALVFDEMCFRRPFFSSHQIPPWSRQSLGSWQLSWQSPPRSTILWLVAVGRNPPPAQRRPRLAGERKRLAPSIKSSRRGLMYCRSWRSCLEFDPLTGPLLSRRTRTVGRIPRGGPVLAYVRPQLLAGNGFQQPSISPSPLSSVLSRRDPAFEGFRCSGMVAQSQRQSL